ncbi:hypothetical protein Q1695_001857 [Nippostrongylus brasiliensis]|nr:hypothetical protein Q1695_001857 [Nippostrongylus brasiliensis]
MMVPLKYERSRPYNGDGPPVTTPTLKVTAQYVHQKNTIVVKVISLHACDLLADDVTQVRLSLSNHKGQKQQTTVARGEEPMYNQVFTMTGIDQDALMLSSLRFRVYSRSGKSRMNLRAEGMLEGKKLCQHGQILHAVPLTRIKTIKSEVVSVRQLARD